MDMAKIRLSEEEYDLVQNADWLLTKNRIITKVYNLFGFLAESIKTSFEGEAWDEDVFRLHAKISRGENYKGLPYVMLDYPRYFGKQDRFAVRNFFWWGNFFSTTIHLKGVYQFDFAEKIATHLQELREQEFFISTGTDEWRHDFESDSYTSLSRYSEDAILDKLKNDPFCKIAKRLSLKQFNEAYEHLENSSRLVMGVMIGQFPRR
jgi:hypothetical protein